MKQMSERVRAIPLHQIALSDRRREDYGDIDKLAASIKKVGLLHPVIAQRIGDDQFRVVAGGRRLKALQMLNAEFVPTRFFESLTDDELREIEIEENEGRKDFTPGERGRTFKAAKQLIADVERVAAVISAESAEIKTESNPKGAGRKPKHGVALTKIAAALGTAETNIREAEQHVETAERYPFMQGDNWREHHALEARAILQRADPEEEQRIVEVVEGAGVVQHPKDALDVLRKLADNSPTSKQQAAILKLMRIKDPGDRDLASTRMAGRLLTEVIRNLGTAAKLLPADPETGDFTAAVDMVRNIRKRISKAPRSVEQGRTYNAVNDTA